MSPTIHQMLRRGRRVLATLLAAGMTLAAAGFVLAGLAGFQRYVIVGGSMTGTYDLGSVVFDRPVPVRELRVGDVITYLPPPDAGVPHLVTHRIAQIRSVDGHTVFRTKGDANPAADPWRFQLDAPTQARVQLSVPYVGFVFLLRTRPALGADPADRRAGRPDRPVQPRRLRPQAAPTRPGAHPHDRPLRTR